ncbi:ADP-ribosyltransferase [Bifidobacterium apri]|uniref:ADP-ribosyltransferase n=1 Tax=Bifidobacterium apri TaxID=1769423 RepID=UPI0039923144
MIGGLAGGHGVGVRPGEGVRIRILLPPGTHCAYLQNVTQVKEEHEILLPRGVKLKVISHDIDKDYERYVYAVLVSGGQS